MSIILLIQAVVVILEDKDSHLGMGLMDISELLRDSIYLAFKSSENLSINSTKIPLKENFQRPVFIKTENAVSKRRKKENQYFLITL